MPRRVVIAGTSTRAAAASASQAGFAVTAIDGFGDLDQAPSVRSVSLPRDANLRFTPSAAARIARTVEADAAVYLSSFENCPGAVRTLATGRALWGNSPEVLRRVRDPLEVATTLARRGLPAPAAARTADVDGGMRWLVKPLASGGGHGVRAWRPGSRVSRRSYLQQYLDGPSGSVVFVAARGRAVPLATTWQLVGEAAFGASAYQYCGNLLSVPSFVMHGLALADASTSIVNAMAEDFALAGVGSVDVIVHGGRPYPVEVNPRWTASMELVERAFGLSMFATHVAACTDGVLPGPLAVQPGTPEQTFGKAVVFARATSVAGDTSAWLRDPDIRDIPRRGDRLAAGDPVCTVFAVGAGQTDCHAALVRKAASVYDALSTWEVAVA